MPGTTQTSLLPLSTLLLLAQVVMVVVSSDRGRNISLWSMMVASRKLKVQSQRSNVAGQLLVVKVQAVPGGQTQHTMDTGQSI